MFKMFTTTLVTMLVVHLDLARALVAPRDMTVAQSAGQYSSVGCYSEGSYGRALISDSTASWSTMTPSVCAAYCGQNGYTLFGVEYSAECYCGNMLQQGSAIADPSSCNMGCAGNNTLSCGGPNRLNVYSINGQTPYIVQPPSIVSSVGSYKFVSCYTEGFGGRALDALRVVNSQMTVEVCSAACNGYQYFGLEYSSECYCANAISHAAAPTLNSDCNMLCTGNQSEYCGAGNRIQLYSLPTTTTTSALTLATPAIPTPSVKPYVYAGCYTEGASTRALMSATWVDYSAMTVEKCAAFCLPNSPIFGLEYGGECYCGSVLQIGSVPTLPSDCSMVCDGNSTEICGAGYRLSLYTAVGFVLSSATLTPAVNPSVPVPSSPASVGNYTYQGCYTDDVGLRSLSSNVLINYSTMTVEACAAFCAPYLYFGVEYSNECYCGNSLISSSQQAGGCNMLCNANPLEYCGGSNRLNVYARPAPTISSSTSTSTTSSTSSSTTKSQSTTLSVPTVMSTTTSASVTSTTSSTSISTASSGSSSASSSSSSTSTTSTSSSTSSSSSSTTSPTTSSTTSPTTSSTSSTTKSSTTTSSTTTSSTTTASTTTASTTTSSTTTASTTTSPTSTAKPQLVINQFFNGSTSPGYAPWAATGTVNVYQQNPGQQWAVPVGNRYASVYGDVNTPSTFSETITLPTTSSASYKVGFYYRQTYAGNMNAGTCTILVTLGSQTVFSQLVNSATYTFSYTMAAAPAAFITLSGSTTAVLSFGISCTGSTSMYYDYAGASVTLA